MLPGTNLVMVFALFGAAAWLAHDIWDYCRALKQEEKQEQTAQANRPLVVVTNTKYGPAPGGDKSA